MCETLREPVKVLKSLSEKTTNKEYKFKRLYRNLYNPEFYFLAYKNISQSQGSMTPGVDGKSLDGMSEKRINALIESLKDFSYQPNPARRVYIEKKNSTKKRPLGIPSTEDKLVQEVVKMILESIYEPNFSDYSHGFRPNRSCHSALQQIQNQFTGITWFVEGDIHACFDSFDHHVLVTDKTVYTTEVTASRLEFADGKDASGNTPIPFPEADADGFQHIPDGYGEELPFR